MKRYFNSLVSFVFFLLLFAGCTTDSGDDDSRAGGVKGSLVSSKVAGDEVNGFVCNVSKTNSSAYLKMTQFIDGSFFVVNEEYRLRSIEDGFYSVWVYVDMEFNNFPKNDAMALCRDIVGQFDADEESVECSATEGHAQQLVSEKTNTSVDSIVGRLENLCESQIESYVRDSSQYHGSYGDDEDPQESSGKSGTQGMSESTSTTVVKSGEDYKTIPCETSNVGEIIFVQDSGAAFICSGNSWVSLNEFNELKPNGDDLTDDSAQHAGENSNNGFSCNVSVEDGKVYQRVVQNQFGAIMNMETVYEETSSGEWMMSVHNSYEGNGAASFAKDMCEEYKEGGLASVTCNETSVDVSETLTKVSLSASALASQLQKSCDELKEDYNGVDFDGPRETSSEIPTSCKVTEGESSLTLNVTYSDWAYSSTVTFGDGKSHEVQTYSGNYGDLAERQCRFDEMDSENVSCDGPVITVDDTWDESMTISEMKSFAQYMCGYLLDGTMSFEELFQEE